MEKRGKLKTLSFWIPLYQGLVKKWSRTRPILDQPQTPIFSLEFDQSELKTSSYMSNIHTGKTRFLQYLQKHASRLNLFGLNQNYLKFLYKFSQNITLVNIC